jgi:sugar O-acyltransferase (sialic acid O-acetyltransferase NeuD family)
MLPYRIRPPFVAGTSMEKPVIIFGAGHFAEVVHFYLTKDAGQEIAAFAVDGVHLREPSLFGLPVLALEELPRAFPPSHNAMFIALGPNKVNQARAEKFEQARALGYELISYISTRASVWPDLAYGPNTFIMETSCVMPFVRLGQNVSLWGARVAHHCTIGDHCLLTAATLAGGVTVGDHTFIGVNASIKERVSIGKRNVIGAGAVILRSTEDDAVHAVHHTKASRVPSGRLRVT